MSQAEIKEVIIERIQSTTDESVLHEISRLMKRSGPARLTDAQRAAIAEGKAQIAAGDYLTHDEAVAEELD